MEPSKGEITGILRGWQDDKHAAIEALTPIVYSELRRIAAGYMGRQRRDHTLQPTALINEAYVRLIKQEDANLKDRTHFYALAARMMRQILTDAARSRLMKKRDHGSKVEWNDQIIGGENGERAGDFFALNEALTQLEQRNAKLAQMLELKYFGGLQLDEIAELQEVSVATVKRELTLGKAWLRRVLTEKQPEAAT